jgi:thiol-disulfide isomerase/thioredoxin
MNIELLDGAMYDVKEGKPLVLHFWATWCPTCRLENSNIDDISKKYNVLTIAVNSGKNEAIKAYMKANNFTFDVFNDSDGQMASSFNVEAYPTTFIYDSKGKLAYSEVGYTTTVGMLARLSLL